MKSKRFKFLYLGSGLALLTLLVLGVVLNTGQAGAAPTAALLWLNPVEAIGVTGSSAHVDLELSDITNVYGIQVYLAFDPDILSVVGSEVTPGVCPYPDFVVANTADNVLGTLEYAVTSLNPTVPCDGGDVATIEFLCAEGLLSEVTTPITITSSIVASPDGEIAHSTQNGAVKCEANIFFIDGVVDLQGWPTESGVQVDLKNAAGAVLDTAIVGAGGAFGFTGTTGETYSVEASYDRYLGILESGITSDILGEHVDIGTGKLPTGDINGDGVVNILDISAVAGNFGKSTPETWAP